MDFAEHTTLAAQLEGDLHERKGKLEVLECCKNVPDLQGSMLRDERD